MSVFGNSIKSPSACDCAGSSYHAHRNTAVLLCGTNKKGDGTVNSKLYIFVRTSFLGQRSKITQCKLDMLLSVRSQMCTYKNPTTRKKVYLF